MVRPNEELNLKHFHHPCPGDYWHEMFCAYHIVLKITGNETLVIAEKDTEFVDGQRFKLWEAFEITKEEHCKRITYNGRKDEHYSMLQFLACVSPKSKVATAMVSEWEEDYGGKYTSLKDREKKDSPSQEIVYGEPGISWFTFKDEGFSIIDALENQNHQQPKKVEATACFKYRDYNISFTTLSVDEVDYPKLVAVWEGDRHDKAVTAADTVEEAIKFIDSLYNK